MPSTSKVPASPGSTTRTASAAQRRAESTENPARLDFRQTLSEAKGRKRPVDAESKADQPRPRPDARTDPKDKPQRPQDAKDPSPAERPPDATVEPRTQAEAAPVQDEQAAATDSGDASVKDEHPDKPDEKSATDSTIPAMGANAPQPLENPAGAQQPQQPARDAGAVAGDDAATARQTDAAQATPVQAPGPKPVKPDAEQSPGSTDAPRAEKTSQQGADPGAAQQQPASDASPPDSFAAKVQQAVDKAAPRPESTGAGQPDPASAAVGAAGHAPAPAHASQTQPAPAPAQPLPDPQTLAANQEKIISGIRTQLLPGGGTMQIRLDPPELGAMQVRVEMHGEMLTATFQASSDSAARMLSHGLAQLRHALEQQGVSVDRLQVVHTPRSDSNSAGGEDSGQSGSSWQGYQQQQDQARRQTLQRLWDRVRFGADPLDLVA